MSEFDEERQFGDVTLRRKGKLVRLEHGGRSAEFQLNSLTELFEEPDLVAAGTTRIIAAPPTAYLLFGRGTLGVENVTSGDYRLTWIELSEECVADGGTCSLGGGDETFDRASDGDVILVLERIGR